MMEMSSTDSKTPVVDMDALAQARADAERMLADAQAKVEAAAAAQADAEAIAKVTRAQELGTDLTKALRTVTDALKAGDLDKAATALMGDNGASQAFSALVSHIRPQPEPKARSHRRTSEGGTSGRDDVKVFFSDPERAGKEFTNQAVANETGRSSGFVGNITTDLTDEGWLELTKAAPKTYRRIAVTETA
jgi:hypothetical protein